MKNLEKSFGGAPDKKAYSGGNSREPNSPEGLEIGPFFDGTEGVDENELSEPLQRPNK